MKESMRSLVVRALTWEARRALLRHRPTIILVAGSVGKTSTKDAVAAGIAPAALVRKSEKSLNSDIGVPLAILGLESGWGNPFKWISNLVRGYFVAHAKEFPSTLVLELGADHPGDVRSVLAWLRPDVGVMTTFPDTPVHVEFFPSREALWDEDAEVIRALSKDGLLIGNGDDRNLAKYLAGSPAPTITYGFSPECSVRGSAAHPYGEGGTILGMEMRVGYKGEFASLRVPGIVGTQLCYSMLAGIAAGVEFDLPLADAAKAVSRMELPKGRMRIFPGKNGSLLIDDTYNSSPVAAEAALRTLESLPAKGRKVAVLGDMRELGGYSVTEHRKIGLLAGNVADAVIGVGESAKDIVESAKGKRARTTEWYATSEEAGRAMEDALLPGDIVLVKGSQGVRMERCARRLLADSALVKELPRQERAWRSR